MTQVNTITDLGFVGGKHLYHLKATGVAETVIINMPCDQIQAVVGGALNADDLTAFTINHPCWQPGDHHSYRNWS